MIDITNTIIIMERVPDSGDDLEDFWVTAIYGVYDLNIIEEIEQYVKDELYGLDIPTFATKIRGNIDYEEVWHEEFGYKIRNDYFLNNIEVIE